LLLGLQNAKASIASRTHTGKSKFGTNWARDSEKIEKRIADLEAIHPENFQLSAGSIDNETIN
jgi:hypothetical protein